MNIVIKNTSVLIVSSALAVGVSGCGGSSSGADELTTTPTVTQLDDAGDEIGDNDIQNVNVTDSRELPAAIRPPVAIIDNGNPLFYRNANNSAVLTGPVFGSGTLLDSDVVEKIDVYGLVGDPESPIVAAYAVRDTFDSNDTTLILVYYNSSDSVFCPTATISALNKDGTYVVSNSNGKALEYLLGRDGSNFLSRFSSSVLGCLAPSELVYESKNLSPFDIDFDDSEIEFGTVAGITNSFVPTGFAADLSPAEPVIPLSYTVNENDDIEVLVENRGSSTIEIGLSRAYPLSLDGLPMDDRQSLDEPTLGPGESGILRFPYNGFMGSASTLRVVISVDSIGQ